jgi:hypothetical protein
MSQWIDIDGSKVTAGSPGKLAGIYIDLMAVTGAYNGWKTDLAKVRAIAEANGDHALVRRCNVAIELVTGAARLFNWPEGTEGTTLDHAEYAARILDVGKPNGGSGIFEYRKGQDE